MPQLRDIFEQAIQRIEGKGQVRHGSATTPLDQQPLFSIPRSLSADESAMLFQAVKKIYESRRLTHEAAINELLDAIVYIAAAVLYKEELAKK